MVTKYDDPEYALAGVKTVDQPSAFDEFWGTLVDVDIVTGPNPFRPEQMSRNYVFTWKRDVAVGQYMEHKEEYPLPTDPTTGEPRVDDDGNLVAPYNDSKWGRQRALFEPIGLPWGENIGGLIGVHAFVQKKGTTSAERGGKRRPRSEFPLGRYLVAWDYYDNAIRKQAGLPAITATYDSIVADAKGPEVTAEVSDEDGLARAAEITNERTYIQYVQEVKKTPELARFANRDSIRKMIEEGLIVEVEVDGKTKYQVN